MGLVSLILYGVGDMLGAGIYGLVGKAAGLMGNLLWLGFLGSMLAAVFTGLSYASIGSRYPKAAGAAYVAQKAYQTPLLTWMIGLAITASGLTSMATGSRVVAGYLQKLGIEAEIPMLALGMLLIVAGIVFWGIRESTWMNALCTTVELCGLLIVIAVGIPFWGEADLSTPPPAAASSLDLSRILVQGAVLTFFSFIGFEDMINVAEEAKNPEHDIPRAIVVSLIVATSIYLLICLSALSVMSPAELSASKAPLVDVVGRAAPWFPSTVFTGIGIFAVANTALLNCIMGSRILYGMSQQKLLPSALAKVHPTRKTPYMAILALLAIVSTLMLTADIDALASATSLLLLLAFIFVNLGLFLLQRRKDEPKGAFEVPQAVPVIGALICSLMVVARVLDPAADPRAPMIVLVILGVLGGLYLVARPENPILE
jgi:amino acid transporter